MRFGCCFALCKPGAVPDFGVEGLQGLSGYYPAMLMAAFSTAADLSTPEQRTVRVARVEGAIFLGLTVGSSGGAALASAFSFESVFVAATAIYGIGLLVLLMLVPESLPRRVVRCCTAVFITTVTRSQ